MQPVRYLACIALLQLLAGCRRDRIPRTALAPRSAVDHPALGCWQITGMGHDDPFLPNGVRFQFAPDVVGPADYPLDSAIVATDSVRPSSLQRLSAVWAPFVSGDSIYFGIGDGFSGVDLRLSLGGDTLVGYGRPYTDFPAVSQRYRVVAHRVACTRAASAHAPA